MNGQVGTVTGAADHQPAHAVGQHADLAKAAGPVGRQLFQLRGQCVTVLHDGEARVVAQIDGQVTQRLGQHLPVIDRRILMPGLPLQIVHAQPVHHQQYPCARGSCAGRACQLRGLPR